jgi:hypothetical protein
MRLSNGTSILYVSDSLGHAIVLDGIDGTTTLSHSLNGNLMLSRAVPKIEGYFGEFP